MTSILASSLTDYLYQEIWNETPSQYRVNIKLSRVGYYQQGHVFYKRYDFDLPTLNESYILATGSVNLFFNAIELGGQDLSTWKSLEELNLSSKVLYFCYNQDSRLFPRAHTYLRVVRDRVFLAIKRSQFRKCGGYPADTIYLMPFYEEGSSVTVTSHTVTASTIATIQQAFITAITGISLGGIFLYINGEDRYIDPSNPIAEIYTIQDEDIVEWVIDTNVEDYVDFVINEGSNKTYASTRDDAIKHLLHIPKAKNPTNKLITHNGTHLSVYPTGASVGRYVNRADYRSITNVTHNDLSLKADVVDTYKTMFDTSSVTVRLRYKTHISDNTLINEFYRLAFLYSHDDETIVNNLLGEGPSLDVWSADELESSLHMAVMFNLAGRVTDLTDYVNGLGYYTVASLFSTAVHRATFSAANEAVVNTSIYGDPGLTFPLVFPLDTGQLAPPTLTSMTVDGNDYTVHVDPSYRTMSSIDAIIHLVRGEDGRPYKFTPTSSVRNFTLPYTKVDIYERFADTDGTFPDGTSTTYGYRKIDPSMYTFTTVGSVHSLITLPGLDDKDLYIYPKYGVIHRRYDITSQVRTRKGTVYVPADISCANSADMVPLFADGSRADVYTRGYKHIDGTDVEFSSLQNASDASILYGTIIFPYSKEHLGYADLSSSIFLDLILHAQTNVDYEVGFVKEDKISNNGVPNVYSDKMSQLWVRGRLIDPTNMGLYYTGDPSQTFVRSGSPYEFRSVITSDIADELAEFSPTAHRSLIQQMVAYGTDPIDPQALEVVPGSYPLYSPYLAEMVYQIANGLTILNDPIKESYLLQFKDFDYLKSLDPTLTPSDQRDLAYVDILSTYVSDWTLTVDQLKYIKRLVDYTLQNDTQTVYEDLS